MFIHKTLNPEFDHGLILNWNKLKCSDGYYGPNLLQAICVCLPFVHMTALVRFKENI